MLMVKAYAKINLGLKITGRDENDGYHILNMVELPIELHDRIEISLLPDEYETIITCDEKSVPTDETNIVSKTIRVLREKVGLKQNFRIHIHKVIPIGSGLGGGSADAAAVLNALNKALKLKLSLRDLCEIGSLIGSDVPFCILNKACQIESKGEVLKPIKCKKGFKVLLAKPSTGLLTKAVYQKYDEIQADETGDIDLLIKGLETYDEELIKNNLVNDLEAPAMELNPDVRKIKEIMKDSGIELCQMTGSGSCVFGLSQNQKLLEAVQAKLSKQGYTTFITKTI